MKKLLAVMMTVAILAFAGTAFACDGPGEPACPAGSISQTWKDTYDPTPDIFFGTGGVSTYSFTFDITKAGFVRSQGDLVNSYVINMNFADDCYDPLWALGEGASVTVDGNTSKTTDFFWKIQDLLISGTATTLLNVDGTLGVTIARTSGDFYFDDATLTAKGCDFPPTSVPEPTTMLLLGLGLIGVAGIARKIKK